MTLILTRQTDLAQYLSQYIWTQLHVHWLVFYYYYDYYPNALRTYIGMLYLRTHMIIIQSRTSSTGEEYVQKQLQYK